MPQDKKGSALAVDTAVTMAMVDKITEAKVPERELSRRSNVHRSQLRRTCNLERQFSITEIVALCWALELDPAKLIHDAIKAAA